MDEALIRESCPPMKGHTVEHSVPRFHSAIRSTGFSGTGQEHKSGSLIVYELLHDNEQSRI
jgi:hypothetical protein